MGEAEEDQRRLALQILVGHDLAGLVGELKRTADRGRRGDAAQAAHRPQHQHQPDDQAAGEGCENHQRAGGPVHRRFPLCPDQKQAEMPAAIISKNTVVP